MFFAAVFVIGRHGRVLVDRLERVLQRLHLRRADFTSYPITVYGEVFRRLFAFGLGFAFVSYYPTLAIPGQPDPLGLPPWVGWLSPLVAALMSRSRR